MEGLIWIAVAIVAGIAIAALIVTALNGGRR